ncbi:carbonyl reductase [NADPH] 2-like [Mercenaria mercenaria]|uniref:carbonyl reductase [NADPH] 2-like n=1 Tax=Mercenaria mercenaria TaxID=6596 RepID=UPI00234F3426|nr:carbonyl reductase [NADPH] 2-like [Mercenaria mercenaria]
MAFKLAGKKFLVTGAGQGIGRELSKTLSEHGCKVYALSKTKDTLDTLEDECENIHTIHADIGNWDEVREKLKDVEVLDGLVNNAAYVGESQIPSLDVPKSYLDKIVGANLLGTINVTQIIGRKMVDAMKSGSIVNVSSIWSMQAVPGYLPYTVHIIVTCNKTKICADRTSSFGVNDINPTLYLNRNH